jgi:hypothetical protein
MPQEATVYQIILVPNPLGGTDEEPNYRYCQYISLALAHECKRCTCWDWECTIVVRV